MTVNPSRALGEKIRTLRLDAGLTQHELALRMGFNDGVIALTERGERAPTQQFLDSFHTENSWERWLKYRAVYRLTFDASHTHLRAIEELRSFYSC